MSPSELSSCIACGKPQKQPEAAATAEAKGGSLQQPGSVAALKQQVSKILIDAVQGIEQRYRLEGYIRWGLVEREIHQAIENALNSEPPNNVLGDSLAKANNTNALD